MKFHMLINKKNM